MTDAITVALDVARIALMAACASFAWQFVWLYRRTTWRDTPEGGHLLRFTAAIGLTFTLAVIFSLAPIPLIPALVVSVAVYAVLAVELRRRVGLFRAAQREHDDDRSTP